MFLNTLDHLRLVKHFCEICTRFKNKFIEKSRNENAKTFGQIVLHVIRIHDVRVNNDENNLRNTNHKDIEINHASI